MLPKWIKYKLILFFIVMSYSMMKAQVKQLSIDEAIESAIKTHPLNGQKSLLADQSNLNIKYLEKKNLPDIDFNAQASLQSESIDLEFPLPKFEPISLPLYRAQTDIESNYLLYDGGIKKALINNEKLKSKIEQQDIETKLYQLKENVVDIYYSIMLLEKQKDILDSSMIVLTTQENIVQSAIKNGVALRSDLNKLEMEKIKIKQKKATIQNKIITLKVVLGDLTGLDLSKAEFTIPLSLEKSKIDWSNRPEFLLLKDKKELLEQSKSIIKAKKKPKVVLFAKAGVGYPNPFNFFDDNIAPYAIGGVKFMWNIWDWKKSSIEGQKLELKKSLIDNQKAILDENIKKQINKLVSEIDGIESNKHFDEELIEKQEIIIETIKNQYLNGIANIGDYTKELNAKTIMQIQSAIHDLEEQKLKYKLKILLNK